MVRASACRASYPARVRPGSSRTRALLSAVLIVVACLLTFLSVIAVWMRSLVLDTRAYVRAVGPLIEQPALREEIAQQVVDQLYGHVDVEKLLADALPPKSRVLAPTLARAVHDTAIQLADSALATPAVRTVWEQANRIAHEQVVQVLEGKGRIVTTARGEVAIDLRPVVQQVRRALAASGIHLFDSVPTSALDRRFVLFRSVDLTRAQRATRVLDDLATGLPIATLAAFGGGIAFAADRRRALGRSALAVAATMVVLVVGLALGRSYYLAHVDMHVSRAAAAVPFDGLLRSLRLWARVIFAGGVLTWFGTWVAGSREVVAREREVRLALARVVRAHGRVLAGVGVVLAAVVLVAWNRPRPRAVLAVLAVLVVWELVLRALARDAPAAPPPA